jgi:protein-tyrosine-phosphatase
MAEADRLQRARVLSALGDPIRLGIVDSLVGRDLSPDSLSAMLEVPGNLLAHHLNVLRDAGVIARQPSQHDRRRTYVHLEASTLTGLLPSPAPFDAPRVVFVCTHNSARSVLADAAWRAVSDVPSTSAGTRPAEHIHPRARAAAARAGLAIAQPEPQHIEDVLRPDDFVVSVCDSVNEELADLTNPHVHWSIPDPARVDTDRAFAQALDEITDRVHDLATRLLLHPATTRSTT